MGYFKDQLKSMIKELREQLDYYINIEGKAVGGTIVCQKNRGKDQILHVYREGDRKVRESITRNPTLQKELAQKEFAIRAKSIIDHNIKVLQQADSQLLPFDPDAILRSMNKSYRKLPEEFFFDRNHLDIAMHLPGEMKARIKRHRAWGQQPYRQSNYKPEYKKHRTSRGEMVRSKSEALIKERLYYYEIDHHYEQIWILGQEMIVPDFTFEDANGNPFFLEHMGMMDDPKYRADNYQKLMKYYKSGLILGRNLILTFDRDGTIDMAAIDHVISDEIIPRL